jgi:hypothetical protein
MTTYSRRTTCTKGHAVTVAFDWDELRSSGTSHFVKICPVDGCDGAVVGTLPRGADRGSLSTRPAPRGPSERASLGPSLCS